MKLKDRFQTKITMTVLQRQCLVIVTMLSTLLFISIWPRFLADALSVNWVVYLILIGISLIPFLKRT